MRKQIINQTYDEERALYNLIETDVIGCTFAGPADGESAFKEARDIAVRDQEGARFGADAELGLRLQVAVGQRVEIERQHADATGRKL